MRLLFELSGEHPSLPAAEAEAVASSVDPGTRRFLSEPGLLGLELPRRHDFPLERLAYTHAIHRHLFSCPVEVVSPILFSISFSDNPVSAAVFSTMSGRSLSGAKTRTIAEPCVVSMFKS